VSHISEIMQAEGTAEQDAEEDVLTYILEKII
jgi:hypothetical protein